MTGPASSSSTRRGFIVAFLACGAAALVLACVHVVRGEAPRALFDGLIVGVCVAGSLVIHRRSAA